MSIFVKLIRSEDAEALLIKYPNAFLLLTQIALRARREPNKILGLDVGECVIGDFSNCGLTEQKYRTAKKLLEKLGIATFKATNKGTVAKLINSDIYDINVGMDNEQANEQVTNKQRTSNEQVTNKQRTSNEQVTTNKNERMKECKNERKKERKKERTICPEPVSGSSLNDEIFITIPLIDKSEHQVLEVDVDSYAELYPAVDVKQELRGMKGWCQANPTKRKTRKGISRFINNWLARTQDKGGSKTTSTGPLKYSRTTEQNIQTGQAWLERKLNEIEAGNGEVH